MNKCEALAALDKVIAGKPNTTHNEHVDALLEVRQYIADASSVPPPTAPDRRRFRVDVNLSEEFFAGHSGEAFDEMMTRLEDRDGFDITSHLITELHDPV
jgi:hypothetical protein